MKYKSKDIERSMHRNAEKYGSIEKVPTRIWKPFQIDFENDSQATHHYYVDENTYYWNTPLKTCRTKLLNVAKLLRETNHKKQHQVLKKLHISLSSYNNTVYQCHMCHRCYKYKAKGFHTMYASFRDELINGIKFNHVPGPQTQTALSVIFHNHGKYQPNPMGPIIGHASKLFTYRELIYYSSQTAMEENKHAIIIPFQRVKHKNV